MVRTLALGSTVILLGCMGPNPGGPEPAEDCSGEGLPADGTGLPPRTVELGYGNRDATWRSWDPGETVKYVQGGQGFTMLTPDLRVERAGSDPDPLCLRLSMEHFNEDGTPHLESEGGDPLVYTDFILFRDGGDSNYAGPVFDIFYDPHFDVDLELRTTVVGLDFVATGSIVVHVQR